MAEETGARILCPLNRVVTRAKDPLAACPSAEDAENERLRAENEQLRADVAELQADVVSLAAENAALKDKLARLERLISRNSGNSSMAPSGDDQPGRTPPKDKKPHGTRKRKPGKQPGVPGAHLA